ncbi:MAG: mechanosensitive ion channel [Muribaculaceae bacterium]|nr:mechanosensitive ion channel [Muribaculaceae bacterium]
MKIFSFIQSILPGLTPDAAPAGEEVAKETVADLKNITFDEFVNSLVSGTVKFAINLAIAIAVFYVGKFIIKKINRFIAVILVRRKVDESLSTFILSFVRILLYFILIVTCIGIIGIETSSFLALFASAGVAIGMALSGTLQNFAGGVLILLLKPYKVGDYIEVQGFAGTVKEIQIFSTVIVTSDNKTILIPNGALSTSSINNYSGQVVRRVSWTVGISYGDSVDKARQAILEMFDNEPLILKGCIADNEARDAVAKAVAAANEERARSGAAADSGSRAVTAHSPEENTTDVANETHHQADEDEADNDDSNLGKKLPWWDRLFGSKKAIRERAEKWEARKAARYAELNPKVDRSPAIYLDQLADSSVNLTIRAWVLSGDYWTVYFRYNERFYEELPVKAGINFPFPQMDVHFDNPQTEKK